MDTSFFTYLIHETTDRICTNQPMIDYLLRSAPYSLLGTTSIPLLKSTPGLLLFSIIIAQPTLLNPLLYKLRSRQEMHGKIPGKWFLSFKGAIDLAHAKIILPPVWWHTVDNGATKIPVSLFKFPSMPHPKQTCGNQFIGVFNSHGIITYLLSCASVRSFSCLEGTGTCRSIYVPSPN